MKTTLKNLRYAVDKLQELANTTNPEIRTDFYMGKFGCYSLLTKNELHLCGSVGCAIGHMAEKVFPIEESDFDKYGSFFSYRKFSERVFPELESYEWNFLFYGVWAGFQPTFDDFIKRAEHFLKLNGEIGEWEYDTEIKTNL